MSSTDHPVADLPSSLDQVRLAVEPPRWKVYETISEHLRELDSVVDWGRLYDASEIDLETLGGWSAFVGGFVERAPEAISHCIEGSGNEELEDMVYWSSKQIDGNLRQPLAILERRNQEWLDSSTGLEMEEDRLPICSALADVVGRLRNDLRRLAAFVVAEDRWEIDRTETLLFDDKQADLERSQNLKKGLVELLECFHGSEDRMPLRQVMRGFLYGRIQGPYALIELQLLRDRLREILREPVRWALYVDSFQRLEMAARHVDRLLEDLNGALGDSRLESDLSRELASVLDVELLAFILGHVDLGEIDPGRDRDRLAHLLKKKAIKDLGLEKDERARLLEIRDRLRNGQLPGGADLELVSDSAYTIRGRQIVERLRTPGRLPEEFQRLARERQLLLDSEDGIGTYLMLLYGQVQHRDLHLLDETLDQIPLAERQLAVQEIHAYLAKLRRSELYQELEQNLAWGAETAVSALAPLLESMTGDLLPRLQRLALFPEIDGDPGRLASELEKTVEAIGGGEVEKLPPAAISALFELMSGVRDLQFVILPEDPQEVDDPEELLRHLGL